MNSDPELEESNLGGPLSSGNRTVNVDIYRLSGEPEWTLEIVDEYGNSTVWDDTFETDSAALAAAKKAILEESITSFIGPEDGKSNDEWR